MSANAIIPLAYYLHRRGSPANFVDSGTYKDDRDAMRRWLTVALIKRAFSGTPDNVLRPIRRVLQNSDSVFPADALVAEFRGTPRSMDFSEAELDGLLDYTYRDRHIFSVLALLYPWLQYDQRFHIDHIFPRALFTPKVLTAKGIPPERWSLWLDHFDDLGNLQLLQGTPNQEKSSRDFCEWLSSTFPSPQEREAYRKNHLIPDVDLSFENFPEFLAARGN